MLSDFLKGGTIMLLLLLIIIPTIYVIVLYFINWFKKETEYSKSKSLSKLISICTINIFLGYILMAIHFYVLKFKLTDYILRLNPSNESILNGIKYWSIFPNYLNLLIIINIIVFFIAQYQQRKNIVKMYLSNKGAIPLKDN
ncbi:MAG: hypothetical protein JW976_05505 [Syntrophaceae bacterium]|nr:hypothetical protein [Syntrophaceae bacterium]